MQHGLEPLLELAAVLRAGDHRAQVEREQLLVLEAFGDVALDDALGDAFGDRGLADARLADQHGVVLGAAGEHLHDAADLFVAADDRVGLALPRRLGEVARVLLQCLELPLGIRVGHALRASDLLHRLQQRRAIDALRLERLLQLRVSVCREEDVLGGGVLVLDRFGFFPSPVEKLAKPGRKAGLGATGHLGHAVENRAEGANQALQIGASLLKNRRREPARLGEKIEQQVLGIHFGIAPIGRVLLGGNQGLACFGSESIESHFEQVKHGDGRVNS